MLLSADLKGDLADAELLGLGASDLSDEPGFVDENAEGAYSSAGSVVGLPVSPFPVVSPWSSACSEEGRRRARA